MAANSNRIDRPTPIVRADALAYVRLVRRNPDATRSFLLDFGFVETGEPGYLRCHEAGPAWGVHIKAGREDDFVGFGFSAQDAGDLDRLAQATGGAIEPLDGPGGGGCRVRLCDPAGLSVELIHADQATALSEPPAPHVANGPGRAPRLNATVRPELAPAKIFRLGHVVLSRVDFAAATTWYMRHFGLIPTDVQTTADGTPGLVFLRVDRGPRPADHHTIALLAGPSNSLVHIATETGDLDAIGQGQQYLLERKWTHHWGMGRHRLGSQLFDYWKDPTGSEWEHYADGDMMDASYETGYHRLTRGTLWTWGDDLPDSMRPRMTLRALFALLRASPAERRKMKEMKAALDVRPRAWLR